MADEYWKNSPFGEDSFFHPSYDEKEEESRFQRQKANSKIIGINVVKGNFLEEQLKTNNIASDNLAKEKYVPFNPFKNQEKTGAKTITISVMVEVEGWANDVKIILKDSNNLFDVNQEKWGKEVPFQSQIRGNNKEYFSVFSLEIPKEKKGKDFVITAKLTNISGEETHDSKGIIIHVDTNGSILSNDISIENNIFKISNICPIDSDHRSHFVIHCTAGNMSIDAIKKLTNYNSEKKARSKAHVYVMKDGTILYVWPFSERNVWATKLEGLKNLKGQMFHVELNYAKPDEPTKEQYDTLANLYIEASSVEKCWPTIVPHIEVDRGIKDGHSDPTDFNYNHFYEILRKKNVPIDSIPKFNHNRYWGVPNYKVPWASDKISWPPVLEGNPHK